VATAYGGVGWFLREIAVQVRMKCAFQVSPPKAFHRIGTTAGVDYYGSFIENDILRVYER
jgi:hypothetical protein